jgi:hypothetical protein
MSDVDENHLTMSTTTPAAIPTVTFTPYAAGVPNMGHDGTNIFL